MIPIHNFVPLIYSITFPTAKSKLAKTDMGGRFDAYICRFLLIAL